MIRYQNLGKTFKTKAAATKFIDQIRMSKNNKLDRAFVKKGKTGYSIMFYTFSEDIRVKIRAIESISLRTNRVYDYYEIASKNTEWINATYKRLIKLV